MERSQRRCGSDWVGVFSDWRRSGDSQRGYCRREGIPYSAFTYWRRKLDKENNENSLVKVSNLSGFSEIDQKVLTVKLDRIRVELTGEESEELLARVFRALKAVS
jgi:hypothetical protein